MKGRTCPPLSELETLAVGAGINAAMAAHVAGCEVCRATVEEIRKDNQFLIGVRTAFAARDRAQAPSPTPDTPHASLEPELVRGYQIQDELHRGGQGVVYRAVQTRTHRMVAIKMLLGRHGASDRQKERFEREIRMAAGLRHPNIVTVHDSGYISDGRYCLVMEHIDGVTLDRWSRSLDAGRGRDARRQALRARLNVMSKVCDAVLCAHQHSIVHRDLKPANILVDAAGEPHVLDFGIARDIGPEQHTRLTHTGEFAGTLAYASPEQVSGDLSRVDTRSDIYSLGVILYELVSGKMPYAVDGPMSQALRNIEGAEPMPLVRNTRDPDAPWVDDDVSTIVLKALSKDPARRYQTVAALREDIDRSLAGKPIDARRDSTWYVIRKTAGRHKPLLVGAVLVALAIVAGAGVAGYGLLRARDAQEYEAVERLRADSEAHAAQEAGRLIQQLFVPGNATLDDAVLGGYVRAGKMRILARIRLGVFADDVAAEATAQSVVASELLRLESPADAEVYIRMAIASLCKEHGESHPALAEAFHELAEILLRRGSREVEAERSVRRAIEIRRSLFRGSASPVAVSRHLLARILLARGDAAGAAVECEEAVEALRLAGKLGASRLAAALATRSDIHGTLHRTAEAEADAIEGLVLALDSTVDDDELFVIECLLRNADLQRAESVLPPDPALAEALQMTSRTDIADALARAAHGLRARGGAVADCLAHAEGLETVLRLRTSFFGSDHASVARTAASIAGDHFAALDFARGEAALLRLLPLMEHRFGRNHLAMIQVRELLFECLLCREKYAAAAAVRRHMIETWNAQPEPARDDMWMANEHRWLAFALALDGAFGQAEAEYRACLDWLARAGLSDHYLADVCNGALGWIALHLGRPDEADSLTRAALERFCGRIGVPPDQLVLLQRHRAHVLIARGQLDEAAPLIDEAVATLRPMTHDNAFVACTLLDAIELARQKGDVAAVERFKSELIDARRGVGVFSGE